ncbi:hypothetical protein L6452_04577 [Arctium lappa]|uniref:Uncharacterized protein n=1 Tax=Arctium lappa TaxID=4217 RepID=A0ACB9EDL2_ARCLA|nr:hypothetical protein L6452_04577 [Arctium lappa]
MGYTKGLFSVITRNGEPLVKKMAAVKILLLNLSIRDLSELLGCRRNVCSRRMDPNNPNGRCVSRTRLSHLES